MGTFAPDQTLIVVGGKRKDRNNWSEADDDNNILPCPLKLFDVITGEVIVTLEGHTEELLCVKRVQFKGENYFLSGSQDGYLNKWKMGSDWRYVIGGGGGEGLCGTVRRVLTPSRFSWP